MGAPSSSILLPVEVRLPREKEEWAACYLRALCLFLMFLAWSGWRGSRAGRCGLVAKVPQDRMLSRSVTWNGTGGRPFYGNLRFKKDEVRAGCRGGPIGNRSHGAYRSNGTLWERFTVQRGFGVAKKGQMSHFVTIPPLTPLPPLVPSSLRFPRNNPFKS
jgi:hypothetical protein